METINNDLNEYWIKIPCAPDKYEISNTGKVRAFYKYQGKQLKPHYKLMKPDGNNVSLNRKKFNIPKLMQDLFGVDYYDHIEHEIWKDIVGLEDLYQVSNYGRIRSKVKSIKRKDGRTCYIHERIIKLTNINSGYRIVNLHKDGILKHYLVHRLVATHFIPNPNGYEQVNHKNENKLDNRADNLEWCDRVYNALYGTCQCRRIETRLKNNNGKYGVRRKNTRDTSVKE